ncbi:hypothetical protein NPIL_549101 [Nephila pilipes]|uniref:Uncharacterized protein n=1 Tax=Nephila pilipes TaxID=299642 RepID=A0A8X6NW71_NEPPI|nr:hypothetical protein NPIL_549101 [Nephila pilipes]
MDPKLVGISNGQHMQNIYLQHDGIYSCILDVTIVKPKLTQILKSEKKLDLNSGLVCGDEAFKSRMTESAGWSLKQGFVGLIKIVGIEIVDSEYDSLSSSSE